MNSRDRTELRKALRQHQTEPEIKLWYCLRRKQLGVKFRRQHSIGRYIVDFYCPEQKLVIELDGDSHFSDAAINYDRQRDQFIRTQGMQVLRFTNLEVMENIEGVLFMIQQALDIQPE